FRSERGGRRGDVKQMAELVSFGAQVELVVFVGRELDRQLLYDVQSVSLDPHNLLGIVGQQTDCADAEVEQDLRADAVVAEVGAEAELLVCFHSIQPFLTLELVRLQLGKQANAASL